MTRATAFLLLLVVQAACVGVFILDLLMSIFGFYPVPLAWSTREFMEMGAGVGLLLGLIFGGLLVWRAYSELHLATSRLNLAASAFGELLDARFREWGLTAAERDVALFAIKGLNVQEISQLRDTSEGTVKAQTAAIYRKAKVTGRPQLLSLFIDDMMGGAPVGADTAGPDKVATKAAR